MDIKQDSPPPTYSNDQGDFNDVQKNMGYMNPDYSAPTGGHSDHASAPLVDDALDNLPRKKHTKYNKYALSTIVVTQPSYTSVPVAIDVPNYMPLAVFACICCCWPLGLVAIFKASNSQNALARNDYDKAYSEAQSSKTLSILSIFIGLILTPLIILWRLGFIS